MNARLQTRHGLLVFQIDAVYHAASRSVFHEPKCVSPGGQTAHEPTRIPVAHFSLA